MGLCLYIRAEKTRTYRIDAKVKTNVNFIPTGIRAKLKIDLVFSMSTKDLAICWMASAVKGEVLNERKEALIHPITNSKSTLNKSTKFKR